MRLAFEPFGRPVRTRRISFKFDSILTFSFALAFVYDVFYPPLVELKEMWVSYGDKE
jgi:hypothetical protein